MSLQLFNLTGRTALITGSSRGLGRAFTEGLAGAGARVILSGVFQAVISRAYPAHRSWASDLAWR
ncbi:hypothetical protein [Paracoccus aestuariivivens]|uniref:hypothetical protein n=1 Tax=Paracoccus aestuariivivens TaxID=1820333 RepID=UPI003CCD573C